MRRLGGGARGGGGERVGTGNSAKIIGFKFSEQSLIGARALFVQI